MKDTKRTILRDAPFNIRFDIRDLAVGDKDGTLGTRAHESGATLMIC